MRGSRALAACIAFVAVIATPATVAAAERLARARELDRVQRLLDARDYRALDRLETKWRDLGIVLSDGQPARGAYFYAISCFCAPSSGEEKFREVDALEKRMQEWRRRYPQSRTAMLGPAIVALKRAWAFRKEPSGGYASKREHQAFDDYVERARLDLEAIGAEMADEPEWYARRLEVARLQGMDDARYWALFREATERHPRYLPLYFEGLARSSATPAQRTRYVNEVARGTSPWRGDSMYALLNWPLVYEEKYSSTVVDWPRMKESFQDLVKRYPDEWNLNRFAAASCWAGDIQSLKRVLPRIRSNVMLDAWANSMAVYAACAARVPRRD